MQRRPIPLSTVVAPKGRWRLGHHRHPQSMPTLARVGMLTGIYFTAAKLGLSLATMHENVSLVWPPTGIALAALLLFGYRLWPGVALGAFLANASTEVSLATAAGIGLGNTLEALSGTYLLHRFGFRNSLERLRDVLGLVALAAGVSTTVSATIGVASLCLGGAAPWAAYGSLWWQWWLGDAMGALVVAPVLLTWGTPPRISGPPWRLAEAGALLGALVTVSQIVFGGWFRAEPAMPLAFTLFPFVIWAALRFGPRAAVIASLVASAFAIWGTARHLGPFLGRTPTESLLVLQAFMSVVAVTALVSAAVITQRRRAEEAARALAELGHELVGALDLAQVTSRVVTAVLRLFRVRRVALYRLEPTSGTLTCVAITGEGDPARWIAVQARDGRWVPVSASLSLLRDARGAVTGTLAVIRDMTEREATEAARREVAELRAITLLAGAVAHEVNNPLMGMMGQLDLLAGRLPQDSQEVKRIRLALVAAERIKHIVGRMTHITHVETMPSDHRLPPILDIQRSSDAK